MNIDKYTAITIGPIYKTLSLARKTRELWGASYLFSYIMRRIIEELGVTEKLCLPYHDDLLKEGKGKEAGLFPDRLIYKEDIVEQIKNIEQLIITELVTQTGLNKTYLESYIRIYPITFTLPCQVKDKDLDNNNIVIVANKLLDTIELQEKHFSKDISTIDWRSAVDKINGKLFYKEAFVGKDQQFKFPSIIEIATDDFRKKNKTKYYDLVTKHLNKDNTNDDSDEGENFLQVLSKEDSFAPIKLRPYHKYIAVVQADGDNIGKIIEKIGNDPLMIQKFSSALFEFAIDATQIIKKYGGKAVYVGGDDLLFFAPVANFQAAQEKEASTDSIESIFKLINDIDQAFEQKIIKNTDLEHLYQNNEIPLPSMSYGMSITYSKYPLNEARDTAYALLLKAKEIKEDKNKICFKLHKHSGKGFGFTIDKKKFTKPSSDSSSSDSSSSDPSSSDSSSSDSLLSYNYFSSMVSKIPLQEKLLSSIIYKLSALHSLLTQIASIGDKKRLDSFFDQEFELDEIKKRRDQNKATPKEKERLSFIENIVSFYYQLTVDFPKDNTALSGKETDLDESNISKLYATLRFMKHLTDEEDEI